MIKLAVLGETGRDPAMAKHLRADHMLFIKETILNFIESILKVSPSNVILVSGGSAWAEYCAVQLYLEHEFGGLDLYLPSKFDHKQKKYINTHEGRTLNALLEHCQEITGQDVFLDLTKVVARSLVLAKTSRETGGKPIKKHNINITIKRGFKQRNTLIAKNTNYLLVFALDEYSPKSGDLLHTWIKFADDCNKFYYQLK